jgi:imidazoleglycerol-phosphate dehydratase/histidinol-phosphatase
LQNSFVIGDRITDVELAKNLVQKGFYQYWWSIRWWWNSFKREELDSVIALQTTDWKTIYEF